MDEEAAPDLGTRLERAGWRQCSVFRPSDTSSLPPYLKFDPDSEWLALCTQSCSVCATGPDAEEQVEVIVAKPIPEYDPDSPAAKGRLVRHLHIPVSGTDFAALALDIDRRAFVPRGLLDGLRPSPIDVLRADLKMFKGWISRYYSRIDLPSTLVIRIRKNKGLSAAVRKALKHKLMADRELYTVHEDVERFYLWWKPDRDIGPDENYRIGLLILCHRRETKEYLLQTLSGLASGVKGKQIMHGIVMGEPDVQTMDETTFDHVHEMQRFTEWDEFSRPNQLLGSFQTES